MAPDSPLSELPSGAGSLEDASDAVLMFGLVAALSQAISGPVTAIASSLDAARLDVGSVGVAGARLARAVDRSTSSATAVIATIKQVSLLLKRSQARIVTDLAALTRSVAAAFDDPADGVRVSAQVPDLPPVRIDVDQIGRVLNEVIYHAVDRAGRSGHPVAIDVSARLCGGEVWIEVTGAGESAADLEAVFLLFNAGDAGRRGVGLSIARALAVANEGRLWAEAADSTTRFVLAFQPDTESPISAANSGQSAGPAAQGTIDG
jgi:signal transduction histidine kinase